MAEAIGQDIDELWDLFKKYDRAIEGTDEIIAFENEQRTALVEERARIGACIELAESSSEAPPAAEVGIAAVGAAIGTVVAVDYIVEKARDAYERKIDRDTARIEKNLEKQREWKKNHPGKKD